MTGIGKFALFATALLVLPACSGRPALSPEAMDVSYERALAATAGRAIALAPDAVPRQLERLRGFFTSMEATGIRASVAELYAPDAYLNDNLVALNGAGAIADYLARSLEEVTSLRVNLLGIAQDGAEYYVRWQMTIESPRIRAGVPLKSYGMTHFRFDEAGRVLLHKDFWDVGTGLYEHLPVLGAVLRQIRAAAWQEEPAALPARN